MSEGSERSIRLLGDCGCCEGSAAETPATVSNAPGLPAIAYRVGTHGQFKETMLSRLAARRFRGLSGLGTRDDDDFSIGLLDAWATVGDVLTFYQERAANEAYLRTATERDSILQLARLIGYELQPGVAASAHLAFRLEEAPGAPSVVTVPEGTKVQSIPGPDELPQTFETSTDLVGRPEWTALTPLPSRPHPLGPETRTLTLAGLGLDLKPGDRYLLIFDVQAKSRQLARALRVVEDEASQTTRIDFDETTQQPSSYIPPTRPLAQPPTGPTALSADWVRAEILPRRWRAADLVSVAKEQGWSLDELSEIVETELARPPAESTRGAYVFRVRAASFGHNAPEWKTLPAILRLGDASANPKVDAVYPNDWEGTTLAGLATSTTTTTSVDLDTTYPKIVKGTWAALVTSGVEKSYAVADVQELSRSAFTISAKVTRPLLALTSAMELEQFLMRTTSVFAQSERLALAPVPIPNPIPRQGKIVLSGFYPELDEGRTAILSGEPVDKPGTIVSEVVSFASVEIDGGLTVLTLTGALSQAYVRKTVTLNANVVLATHGESKHEMLGSGDASASYQKFKLAQSPLTYVAAQTETGAESTLGVYVNGVRWQGVPTLYGEGPDSRVYVTLHDPDGAATVTFGDGRTGARVPTGQENVEAFYRKGIGLVGLVDDGQLSLLLDRPLGIAGVTNPLPASGADDPEPRDRAQQNAPLTVTTLGRIVSVRDVEDFAAAFAGIAKALAIWVADPTPARVVLTVALPENRVLDSSDPLFETLATAIAAHGDASLRVDILPHRPVTFELSGTLFVHPDYLPDRVAADVEAALRGQFDFTARALGAPVARSEVESIVQGVAGVLALDLDTLSRSNAAATLEDRLWASVPAPGAVKGAELLTLDTRPLGLTVAT